jgi:DNA-binding beta-propeller fold protein YncE
VLFYAKFIIITKEKKMAQKLIDIRVNPWTNKKHQEFICDTDADFASLPKGKPGDTAVSAATGNVYVVNASGNWVAFGGE